MYLNGRVSLQWDIIPILTADFTSNPIQPLSYEGTGFLAAPSIIVTCWHCVRAECRPERQYCALIVRDEGAHSVHPLSNIAQDVGGTDLASANVDLLPTVGLEIAIDEIACGSDVYTFGYPLTRPERRVDGGISINVACQFLQSYITRIYSHHHGAFGATESYELGMPAHKGLSGAPLLELRSKRVVGVIYGNNDYDQIEEFAAVDPETEERRPEIRRVLSYGLAHHTRSLRSLSGPATGNRPLSELIRRDP